MRELAAGAGSRVERHVLDAAVHRSGLEEAKEQAPCIEFRPWALAHEREPLGAVELAWCLKLDRIHMPPMNRFPRVHALLAAAYAQPVLRQLCR